MEHTIELLDRQVAFLLKQADDAAFLVQVDPFLRALETDGRLASYLEDLREDLLSESDGFAWPQRDGLKWPHLALVDVLIG